VVQDTSAGSDDLPGIKMQDGPLDDIIKPALKYIGAFACALAPATVFLILSETGVIPEELNSPIAVGLWLAGGIFVWPVFVLLFAFNAPKMIFRIDLIFTTILRTFLPYLCLWLMLLVVGFGSVGSMAGPLLMQVGLDISLPTAPGLGLAGEGLFRMVDVYLTIAAMRLIGLYYLHFKKRFTLVFE
jgi:hypothetical protein